MINIDYQGSITPYLRCISAPILIMKLACRKAHLSRVNARLVDVHPQLKKQEIDLEPACNILFSRCYRGR